MPAVTTIAPARSASDQVDRKDEQAPSQPQHLAALDRANRVRCARAALKRAVAAGQRSAAEVIRELPEEARSMTLRELLSSQRRWGTTRSRKFLAALELLENKRIETLTDRQRDLLVGALTRKGTGPATRSEASRREAGAVREEAAAARRDRGAAPALAAA